jgi:CheY-like chemotaxis protein
MVELGTVLHAEDDENDALFFRRALSKVGVRNPIVHVQNGEQALHYLTGTGPYGDREKHPFPCLLITDLKMPVLSGFDLLAQIKDVQEFKQLPAVVLTASVADSDKKRCLELGAKDYFVKPSGLGGLTELALKLKESWIPAAEPA